VAILDPGDAESEIAAAESKVAQAKSELTISEGGGRSSDLTQIDAALARLAVERDAAARECASLERLVKKQAATTAEYNVARDRLASLDAQIAGEKAKRKALVAPVETESLRVRLRDAEVSLKSARERLEKATLRAGRGGVVYEAGVRAGEWVDAGAIIAKVGDTSKLRIVIYVDEPDLGRVRPGMEVVLTWDAMPGRQWQGEVKSAPVEVVALGTRQVGEVTMLADNPRNDLPPGANINAAIRSQLLENALAIPKAALRREDGRFGVYRLAGEKVEWRAIEVGTSSATLAEVRSGLQEGDAVALPSDTALANGMAVRPRFQ
jgi:HlyD family secretion protein